SSQVEQKNFSPTEERWKLPTGRSKNPQERSLLIVIGASPCFGQGLLLFLSICAALVGARGSARAAREK
ncbi:MAG TPA: hypothetical protein DIV46_12270, partial [Verrucomicrobiales bacterium]|nr:hypothetical protein [Verrucomicrobiales bacterium]